MYLGKYLIQTIRLFHNAYLPSTSDLSPRLSMLLEYPFRKLIILYYCPLNHNSPIATP